MPSKNDPTWVPRVVYYRFPVPFRGRDIIGWKRAVFATNEDAYSLKKLREVSPRQRMTFGFFFGRSVKKARARLGLGVSTRCDGLLAKRMRAAGYVDAFTEWIWETYWEEHKPPAIVYPFPLGVKDYICQGLHATGGVPGNWAIDFCAPPGSPVLAAEAATIDKLSGAPPSWDVNDPSGVFGWSTYFTTPLGYRYYTTHYGRRADGIHLSAKVAAGQVIGYVGDQDFRLDHSHYGVTSPFGERDARTRITNVSKAPRVTVGGV